MVLPRLHTLFRSTLFPAHYWLNLQESVTLAEAGPLILLLATECKRKSRSAAMCFFLTMSRFCMGIWTNIVLVKHKILRKNTNLEHTWSSILLHSSRLHLSSSATWCKACLPAQIGNMFEVIEWLTQICWSGTHCHLIVILHQ